MSSQPPWALLPGARPSPESPVQVPLPRAFVAAISIPARSLGGGLVWPLPPLLWRLVSACSCCLSACIPNLARSVPSSHCTANPGLQAACSSERMCLVAVLLNVVQPSLCAFYFALGLTP